MDVTLHGKKTFADVMLKALSWGDYRVFKSWGHFSTVRDERAKEDWRDAILQSLKTVEEGLEPRNIGTSRSWRRNRNEFSSRESKESSPATILILAQ